MKSQRKAAYDKQSQVVQDIKNKIEELKLELAKQEEKEKQLKNEYTNPYADDLYYVLHCPYLVKICLDYLPEKFCADCGITYLGSLCYGNKCPPGVSTYITAGDMTRMTCGQKRYRNEITCFIPDNNDDEMLVYSWMILTRPLDYCAGRRGNHLSLNKFVDGYKLPRGIILKLHKEKSDWGYGYYYYITLEKSIKI